MNKEIARKWVDALRSGEYKQTRGRLRSGDRFCCLGVLCEINGTRWNAAKGWLALDADDIYDKAELPVGDFKDRPSTGRYATLNDDGVSFAEIASQIEKDAGLSNEDTPNG